MDDYYDLARALGDATGFDVVFDEEMFAFYANIGDDAALVGFADEDPLELVTELLNWSRI